MEKEFYDLTILGGGVAGMTAAIYAARANLKVLLLDENACGGLVNSTQTIENMPSYNTIGGMELVERMQKQVESLGVVVEEASYLEELDLSSNPKQIHANDGIYEATSVILATGRKPVPLKIGEDCQQVHYCAVCDGSAYTGKKVLVVGGGNSGFDEALALLDTGIKEITLIEEKNRFFAAKQTVETLSGHASATLFKSTAIKSLHGKEKLTGVTLENKENGTTWDLECDGIFVFMGQEPGTEIFRDHIDLDKQGYILTDELMGTSLPGVFAAGDVRPKKYRQITTAMSDGTIAALEAERHIHRVSGAEKS